ETILTGDVDGDDNPDVYNVVTASDVSGTTIDGFTLTKGSAAGLYCNNASSMTISHNNIRENAQDGISCTDSSSLITDCLVQNSICGITANSAQPVTVQNSRITANYWGIHWMSAGIVKNNWIYGNDDYGIYCCYSDLYARNNTIADNGSYGIKAESSYPTYITVDVDNCIIWGNTQGAFIEDGLATCTAAYSCIQGGWTGDGNIDQDPLFENPTEDDYHLQYHSPCKDTGDPLLEPEPGETDIDGEDRILDGDCDDVPRVDMGADEINFCWNWPTQCHGDADGNGFVGGADFLAMKNAWYAVYPDPNYNPCADFDRDGQVKGSDFLILKEYWYTSPPADCDCGGTWPPEP
ncbi:MAG: right-handed parallel beta-helix repeat-containing protein, partial [Planctomycetota bacterium]